MKASNVVGQTATRASALVDDKAVDVFLSATDGPRRSSQIVIADEIRALPRVVWTFIRATQSQREKEREQTEAAGPKLPL